MNKNLAHWLYDSLSARSSCCFRQPDRVLIFGTFSPDSPSDQLLVSKEQFEIRYGLPFTNAGSPIGEGRVPDRVELQERIRRADNPCSIENNTSYVITMADYTDLRYVAVSGRPVWESIERLGIFSAVSKPDNPPVDNPPIDNPPDNPPPPQPPSQPPSTPPSPPVDTDCQEKLAAANAMITDLQSKILLVQSELFSIHNPPGDILTTVRFLSGLKLDQSLNVGPGVKARLGRFVTWFDNHIAK